jgi:hypothetical protein
LLRKALVVCVTLGDTSGNVQLPVGQPCISVDRLTLGSVKALNIPALVEALRSYTPAPYLVTIEDRDQFTGGREALAFGRTRSQAIALMACWVKDPIAKDRTATMPATRADVACL